jgi:hypothetical protein
VKSLPVTLNELFEEGFVSMSLRRLNPANLYPLSSLMPADYTTSVFFFHIHDQCFSAQHATSHNRPPMLRQILYYRLNYFKLYYIANKINTRI